MAALYELIRAFENFEFEFDEETGELLNADDLDNIEIALDDKIKNCVYYYKNKKAEAEALKAEKMRFAERQKAAERQAQTMGEYLANCLQGEAWQSADKTQKITYRKSDEVVADVAQLPAEYLRYKEPEADKTAIKKAIKAGVEIAGAQLIEKRNIQIK